MTGQRNVFEQRKKIADEYISKANLYQKITPLQFDLRGYAKYVEEHNLCRKNVPSDVMSKFSK